MQRIIVVVLGLLASMLGLEATDPTTWGEPAVLALVVWGIIEYLQAGPLQNLRDVSVTIAAGVVGVALALALGVAQVLTGTPLDWIITGLTATFGATLIDQGAKKIGGSGKAPAA